MDLKPKCKTQTIKLENNMEENLDDLWYSDDFLDTIPNVTELYL